MTGRIAKWKRKNKWKQLSHFVSVWNASRWNPGGSACYKAPPGKCPVENFNTPHKTSQKRTVWNLWGFCIGVKHQANLKSAGVKLELMAQKKHWVNPCSTYICLSPPNLSLFSGRRISMVSGEIFLMKNPIGNIRINCLEHFSSHLNLNVNLPTWLHGKMRIYIHHRERLSWESKSKASL